jgi:hypothetical protein
VDRRRYALAVEVAPVRADRGDPGTDAISFADSHLADEHAGNVGDRVQWTGGQDADDDAGLTRARTRGIVLLQRGGWCGRGAQSESQEGEPERRRHGS